MTRVFSGIKPTGPVQLGNLLGALRRWVVEQDDADTIFCVVDLHALTMPVEPGDCYLICSDGLSNYFTVDEIGRILSSQFYSEAGRTLVEIANERGGDDNITCVVVYVANTLAA